MRLFFEPTSSPRKRPPKGAAVLSVADRLGYGPVADREWRDKFLTFESTPALYAPAHLRRNSSRRNQKTFSDYPEPTKNKIFTPLSSRKRVCQEVTNSARAGPSRPAPVAFAMVQE